MVTSKAHNDSKSCIPVPNTYVYSPALSITVSNNLKSLNLLPAGRGAAPAQVQRANSRGGRLTFRLYQLCRKFVLVVLGKRRGRLGLLALGCRPCGPKSFLLLLLLLLLLQ